MKVLSKIAIVLIFGVLCFNSKAQDCKPDKEVIDKFTKQKTAVYNYDVKDSKVTLSCTFSIVVINDTTVAAVVSFTRVTGDKASSLQPLKISKGQSMFLANDQASVALQCLQDAASSQRPSILSSDETVLTITAVYAVGLKDLETLSKEVLTDFQVRFDQTSPYTAHIKKKHAEKMKIDAACLFKTLNK